MAVIVAVTVDDRDGVTSSAIRWRRPAVTVTQAATLPVTGPGRALEDSAAVARARKWHSVLDV